MRLLFFAVFLALSAYGAVWAPPAANQGAWTPGTDVGISGGLEQYAAGGASDRANTGTLVDMTQAPYNADNTGMSDVRDAIVDAIDDASGPTVLYFPAGTYLLATGFIFTGYKDEITIRGDGDATVFQTSTTHPIFVFSDPGAITDNNFQTVTGTKTKGTTVLSIADDTEYTVGRLITVQYENEVDNTRIIAGAAPVWHSGGNPWARKMLAKVTANGTNQITIAPGLPADGTNLAVRVSTAPFAVSSDGWGFEDFKVTFDAADHTTQFAQLSVGTGNWFYRVKFDGWDRDAGSGSCIRMFNNYRSEIRKCWFGSVGGSSDGAVETSLDTACLIVDNIVSGSGFGTAFYDSGNSCGNVWAYNYVEAGSLVNLFHNTHPSLNLIEGNYGPGHQSDGYHGSSSHQTLFGNRYTGTITLNRFKRNYALAANVLGGAISYGNPNIGNGDASGFAGPTGLSDQVGELDYYQNGVGPYMYEIQPEDVFEGDFWEDWEITGTLTTRTSDLIGVFTVSGGNWFEGGSPTAGGRLYPTVWWNSKASSMVQGEVTDVTGDQVTIEWLSGTLPAETTAVQMYFFATGWQERDLDVQASATLASNSIDGVLTDSIAPDTLPDSLAYAEKPSWFYGLAWPPFNPSSPGTASANDLPAGYRFENNGEDPPAEGGGGSTTISGSGSTTVSGSSSTTIQ